MRSVLPRLGAPPIRRVLAARDVAAAEWVALAFFVYLGILGLIWRVTVVQRILLLSVPVALCMAWRVRVASRCKYSSIVKQWSSLSLILVGYWLLQCFASGSEIPWEQEWLRWDRSVLYEAGLHFAIEKGGSILPSLLEQVYLLLYAIPAVCLGLIYQFGAGSRADRFLLVLFLGTFSAYALLPWFQVRSPRVAFPGEDLPHFVGFARGVNTWLLDHADISTSVFPSGHVAVAFSSAFGLFSVLRIRRWIWMAAFAAATLVYIATVYGRYHYAVDGAASIVLATAAWAVTEMWDAGE